MRALNKTFAISALMTTLSLSFAASVALCDDEGGGQKRSGQCPTGNCSAPTDKKVKQLPSDADSQETKNGNQAGGAGADTPQE